MPRTFRLITASEAEHAADELGRELEYRVAMREPKGRNGQTPRCKGCNQFVTNPSRPHSCGWMPGRGWAG